MPFNQDDARERAMLASLNISATDGRYGADGKLTLPLGGGVAEVRFECKSSAPDTDFGTGRDTGIPQLDRWAQIHWVFGWFVARDNLPLRMWYGSPEMMRAWIEAEREYLIADLLLVDLVPSAITDEIIDAVFGASVDTYTYQDLRRVMKAQWDANAGRAQENLYCKNATSGGRPSNFAYDRSVVRMAAEARVRYLLQRGSTVNNRKISKNYVADHCVELDRAELATSLRTHVKRELESAAPSG